MSQRVGFVIARLLRPGMFFVLLALVGVLAWFPMVDNFFLSDTFDWLVIGRDAQFPEYFLSNYAGEQASGSYRPMVTLLMSILYRGFGTAVVPYHLVSLALHVVTSFGLYVLCSSIFSRTKLSRVIGAVSALLFLLMPTHTEVIMWVAGYPDALAATFMVISMVIFLWYRKTHAPLWLVFSLIAWGVALLSKEHAIMLPFLLVCLDRIQYYNLGKTRNDLWYKEVAYWFIPFALVGAIYVGVRFFALDGAIGGYSVSINQIQVWSMIETFAYIMLVPIIPVATWLHNGVDVLKMYPVISGIAGLGVITAVLLYSKQFVKTVTLLMISAVVSAIPMLVLAFDPVSIEGERFAYTPSIFISIIIAVLLVRVLNARRVVGAIILGILLVYFGGFVYERHVVWAQASQQSEQLVSQFQDIAQTYPGKHLVIIGVPESNGVAPILRNGLAQAVDLLYGQRQFVVERVPIYTRDKSADTIQSIAWEQVDNGFLGTPVHAKFWYGQAVYESPYILTELWEYDYALFRGEQVKLVFRDDSPQKQHRDTGEVVVLFYADGKFQELLNTY